MRVLFIFLDGIGLGENNLETNPFARAKMPNLNDLLKGRSLLKDSAPFYGERATLLAVDPAVGVSGLLAWGMGEFDFATFRAAALSGICHLLIGVARGAFAAEVEARLLSLSREPSLSHFKKGTPHVATSRSR